MEERFFVIRVKWLKDGTIKKSEVMDYDSRIRALAKFHTNIGTDMSDDTLCGSMCAVINNSGYTIIQDSWYDRNAQITSGE